MVGFFSVLGPPAVHRRPRRAAATRRRQFVESVLRRSVALADGDAMPQGREDVAARRMHRAQHVLTC